MKPHINLHGDEKMLFECSPDKKLIAYLYLTRGHVFLVIPVILFLLYSIIGGSGVLEHIMIYFVLGIIGLNVAACYDLASQGGANSL